MSIQQLVSTMRNCAIFHKILVLQNVRTSNLMYVRDMNYNSGSIEFIVVKNKLTMILTEKEMAIVLDDYTIYDLIVVTA